MTTAGDRASRAGHTGSAAVPDGLGIDERAGGEPAIEIERLRVVLGDQSALRGVNFSVRPGARLALVGPNGAGKSTLLRVIAGLLRPNSGEVRVAGRSLASDPWHARRAVGLVGHHSMLHPDLTARENLAVFARLYGLDAVSERVEVRLQQVGLAERGGDRVATLSRGMLQRLALARALLHAPSILLLDEAETGLDARAHEQLVAAISGEGAHRTVILATHDLGFVCEVATEVVFLRAGRVVGHAEIAGVSVDVLRERYTEALARRAEPRARRAVGVGG